MAVFILLALIGVPLLEISVFIAAGERIGLWPILGLVVGTAVVGTALLRFQGLAALSTARESLDRGELPIAQVFDGACLLLAGAFLLTPGFITDALGLLLFVPWLRAGLRYTLWRYLVAHGEVQVSTSSEETRTGGKRSGGPTIIEGNFHEVPPEDDTDGPSGGGRDRRP
jgi:UPF0716 protein FxsA